MNIKYETPFENHQLKEILNTPNLKVFEFRNANGENHMYQRWIIDRGTLIVTGDCYNAIYKWNSTGITLDFLANCNLDYFNEKCLADKDGAAQKEFDSGSAQEYLKNLAADRILDNNWEGFPGVVIDEQSAEQKFDLVKPFIMNALDIEANEVEGIFYCENPYEAYAILTDSANEFMYGRDGWEYAANLEQLTNTPKWHLAALRVANKKHPNAF